MDSRFFLSAIKERKLVLKKYQRGEFVLSQWRDENYAFFLKSGVLKMTNEAHTGDVFNIQYIQSDFLVLSNSIVDDRIMAKYTFEVMSLEAEVYCLSAEQLRDIIFSSKECMLFVIDNLQRQLSFLCAKLNDFSQNGKKGALCGHLVTMAYLFGECNGLGSVRIRRSVTLQELGESSGIAHASAVSRLLAQMKQEQVIQHKPSMLIINDSDYLKGFAPKLNEWFQMNSRREDLPKELQEVNEC